MGRPIWILRPGTKGARGGGGISPEQSSATASSPEKTNPALQGSVRAAVWPWVKYATCVTQLGTKLGTGRFVVARAATAAALRSGARRRVACRPYQCGILGANDSWSLRKARANGS